MRMLKVVDAIYRLISRWRYPVSMPEEVLDALGIDDFSESLGFEELMESLTNSHYKSKNLMRFMPREKAESYFFSAARKERFRHASLYSYYLSDSWVEFVLYFDRESRLRRIYLQHKDLLQEEGVEIALSQEVFAKVEVKPGV